MLTKSWTCFLWNSTPIWPTDHYSTEQPKSYTKESQLSQNPTGYGELLRSIRCAQTASPAASPIVTAMVKLWHYAMWSLVMAMKVFSKGMPEEHCMRENLYLRNLLCSCRKRRYIEWCLTWWMSLLVTCRIVDFLFWSFITPAKKGAWMLTEDSTVKLTL